LTGDAKEKANQAIYGTADYQGDIRLTRRQKAGLKNRVSIGDLSQRWAGGVIPYVIEDLNQDVTQIVEEAMYHIEQKTGGCIRFVKQEEANAQDYLRIHLGSGCWSYMGNINNGAQDVSLGEGCHYFGTAVHELMHAIGFDHEQCRPDRDNFLDIHTENIIQGQEDQFSLTPGGRIYHKNFDYDSIMLYGNTAFTANGQDTMTAKNGKRLSEPYDKSEMSPVDAFQIKQFYKGVCRQ